MINLNEKVQQHLPHALLLLACDILLEKEKINLIKHFTWMFRSHFLRHGKTICNENE